MTLSLTSPAFPPNGDIPKEYTCDGKDLAPSPRVERSSWGHQELRTRRQRFRRTRSQSAWDRSGYGR